MWVYKDVVVSWIILWYAIVTVSLMGLIPSEWRNVLLTNDGKPIIFFNEIFCIASIFTLWESDMRAPYAVLV